MIRTTRWVGLVVAAAFLVAGCSDSAPQRETASATGSDPGAAAAEDIEPTGGTSPTPAASASGGVMNGAKGACEELLGDADMDKPIPQVQLYAIGDPATFTAEQKATVTGMRDAFLAGAKASQGTDLAEPLATLATKFTTMLDAAQGTATWDSDADVTTVANAVTDVIVVCTTISD